MSSESISQSIDILQQTPTFHGLIPFNGRPLEPESMVFRSNPALQKFLGVSSEDPENRLPLPPTITNQINSSLSNFNQGHELTFHIQIQDRIAGITFEPLKDDQGNIVALHLQGKDITDKTEKQQIEAHLKTHDPLTGALNREGLKLALNKVNNEHRKKRRLKQVTVYFLDLDNVKKINDTLGHQKGDEYIANVAKTIAGCLREGDIFARYKGQDSDEFLIVVDGDVQTEKIITERLESVRKSPDRQFSYGHYRSHRNKETQLFDFDKIIDQADTRMRVDKANRRAGRSSDFIITPHEADEALNRVKKYF